MTIVTSYTKDGILRLLADVEWNRGPVGDTKNLNDISVRGLYTQDEDAKATSALNYPVQKWGFLQVFPDGDSGGTIQQYMTVDAMYIRKKSAAGVWTQWTTFQGPKGEKGDIGMQYKGGYSPDTQYYAGDAVYFNHNTYVALNDVKGVTPTFSNANWGVVATRGAAGTPGLVWKGPWSSTVAYAIGDAVFYNGSAYIAKGSGTNIVPTSNATKWELLASKGDPGVPGVPGPPGTPFETKEIPSGDDLNNYSSNGFFVQTSNTNATLALNYPVTNAGLLQVFAYSSMVWQTYIVYGHEGVGSNTVYIRGRHNGTWSTWYRNIQQNDLIVPPAAASNTNSDRVVTLNAEGRLMTAVTPSLIGEATSKKYVDESLDAAKQYSDNKIQVVTALPATPDANTLYLIKEA